MMKKSRWEYYENKRTVSHKFHLVDGDYIIEVIGKQQSKAWDPGRLQKTIIQQKDNKASGQQYNIWDPRGLQQMKHT
jgi:hypothetical protein